MKPKTCRTVAVDISSNAQDWYKGRTPNPDVICAHDGDPPSSSPSNLLKACESAMAKAMWNGQTVAESESFETVEGNIYFPEETVKREFLRPSSTSSSCPWKGQARYFTLLVDGQENPDAAWYYPDPKPAARSVKHHIAFWRGVEVSK